MHAMSAGQIHHWCTPWAVVASAHTRKALGRAVSLDFITDFPPVKGATTILVVVDMLTKMAHLIPCAGLPSTWVIACLFIEQIFWLH